MCFIAAPILMHSPLCCCYLPEQGLSFPASHFCPGAFKQCDLLMHCVSLQCVLLLCVCAVLCGAVRCIIKSLNPALPQLLSLDNLVSTVKSGGHNHCVGFPPGQRWSVWPGRRLAEACFCPELATESRRREAGLLRQNWQVDGISR